MIHRIVKLTFSPDGLAQLEQVLAEAAQRVRMRPGCAHMHMLESSEQPGLVFTYSLWQDEASLAAYRESPAFRSMWSGLKPHFTDKPQAWSLAMKNGDVPFIPSPA